MKENMSSSEIRVFKLFCPPDKVQDAYSIIDGIQNAYMSPYTASRPNHISVKPDQILFFDPAIEMRGITQGGEDTEAEVVTQLMDAGIIRIPENPLRFYDTEQIQGKSGFDGKSKDLV